MALATPDRRLRRNVIFRIHDFAPIIGTGMLDGTVCDLYLVDSSGKLVGRPLLVACVDAYSGLCCGYSLLWEGGVYSVRELMINVIEDKVKWCKQFGIQIEKKQWPCDKLPGVLITDRGPEYISYNFEQISELGCQVISLSSFSANMKGQVEKLFDLIQDSFKPYLRGKLFTGNNNNFIDICKLAFFLKIPIEEIANPKVPEKSQTERFNETVE